MLQHYDTQENGSKTNTTTIKVVMAVEGVLREFIMLFDRRIELGKDGSSGNINSRQYEGVYRTIRREVAGVIPEIDRHAMNDVASNLIDMIDSQARVTKAPYIGKQGIYSQFRSTSV